MNSFINKYLFYYPAVFLRRQQVPKYLRQLRDSQWYSLKHLQEIQFQKLIRLLETAKSTIPCYRHSLKDVNPKALKSLDDIKQIPILTKELLKQNFNGLHCGNLKRCIKKTTGGSTGNPITIYKSAESVGAAYAAYWRGYEWAGVGIGYRQARFWGIPHEKKAVRLARWTDIITNRLRCSAFSFDEEDLAKYYRTLNKFQPTYFYGYVSMLEAFANYLIKHNLKLQFNLTCIITTSEVLTDLHRRLFENAFNCSIYNEYGCGELGTIAHECEKGSMHINAENLLVEITLDGKPVETGKSGDIVVTELNNTIMPLIRYNLKDIGYLSDDSCACGRGLPMLGGIIGRAYDVIYNKEGKAFHGEYFMYIFEELQNLGFHVSSFQVVQLDYENFLIKLVTDKKDSTELENYIVKRVCNTYGPYAKIKFEYVSKIERERSGKIRLIKAFRQLKLPPEFS